MRSILVFVLTYMIFYFAKTVWATESPVYRGPPIPSIQNNMVKEKWMGHIAQTLPSLLCDEKQYFVKCFQVTKGECIEFTSMLVQACLNNISLVLPAELDMQQGEHWGQIMGRCSYDLYGKFMHTKKRQDLTDCNAPTPQQQTLPSKKKSP